MALRLRDSRGRRRVQKTITINRPVAELFSVWRDLERLPDFMENVESVSTDGNGHSHWVVKAPAGQVAQWDAEISDEKENEYIAWESIAGTGVQNAGEVRFREAPLGRGTEVRVSFYYDPPAGRTGTVIAKLLGKEPAQQLDEDLHRFKQIMETGRIIDTDGQPTGRADFKPISSVEPQPIMEE